MHCYTCKKGAAAFACGGCYRRFYCSPPCQEVDWQKHNRVCTLLQQIGVSPPKMAGAKRKREESEDQEEEEEFDVEDLDYRIDPEEYRDLFEVCLKGYQLQEFLAQGTYGLVYRLCKDDCDYVVKVQPLFDRTTGEFDPELQINFIEEAKKTQFLADEAGIGPTFYGYFICDDFGFTITEKWDRELSKDDPLNRALVNHLRMEVSKLHAMHLIHMDILPKNVLVKLNPQGQVVQLTLTDFGLTVDDDYYEDPLNREHLEVMYKYHRDRFPLYFERFKLTFDAIQKRPSLIDYGLLYYMDPLGFQFPPANE